MISLKILDIKSFMSNLLIQQVFDEFLLSELEIQTYNYFKISGKKNKMWYTNEEWEELEQKEYSRWLEIKPIAFQLIKGNKTPSSFKVVFLLPTDKIEQVLLKESIGLTKEDINGLFLNIYYENNTLHLITGTSIRIFTMDKRIDMIWDNFIKEFLKNSKIAWEE